MQTNEKRNEIIRSFRKFSRLGLNSHDRNPIQTYKKIEILCSSRRARIEMLSIYDTLRILCLNEETEIIEAVERVYFEGNAYRLTKHEISTRVLSLAHENHCDERTIYRRLERARNLFEKVREREGLITD